jgi:hypothetical protein
MTFVRITRKINVHLFKFLPEAYVDELLDGAILFRNLVYFKKLETDPRRDLFEGRHVDAPNHNVQIEILKTGRRISGPFAYHNTIAHPDRIFCFCTSLQRGLEMQKYGAACVAIHDVAEFSRRVRFALVRRARLLPLESPALLDGPIVYFDPSTVAPDGVDVTNPRQLPFLKRTTYSSDHEYRFAFSRRGGYSIKRMILIDHREEDDDLDALSAKSVTLRISSIRDIASRAR